MTNILALILSLVVAYLGFELFPWWTPLIAGLGLTLLYCLRPNTLRALGETLVHDSTDYRTIGQGIIDMFRFWDKDNFHPRALLGLSQVLLTMYVMYVVMEFIFFGIGWGLSIIL